MIIKISWIELKSVFKSLVKDQRFLIKNNYFVTCILEYFIFTILPIRKIVIILSDVPLSYPLPDLHLYGKEVT